jgi:FtsH-binding integral membrane protein
VIYALACTAGVYTHLTMAFVVAGHAVVILAGRGLGWRETRGQALKPLLAAWAGATLMSIALYAPYAPNLLAHFGAERPRQAAELATGQWALSEAVRNVLSGAGVVGALVAGVAAAFGAWSFLRRTPFAFALLVVPALVAGAAIVVLGQPMRPRFFFFVAGAAALFVGRSLGAVAGRIATDPRRSGIAIVIATIVVISTSAVALPRNYRVPKQDFDGAVRFLEGESANGTAVRAVGPGCFPIERFYVKADWPCLQTVNDIDTLLAAPGRVLVIYSLVDYIDNAELRDRVRTGCAEVRRFPGTLGGGDVIVCDPRTAVRAS